MSHGGKRDGAGRKKGSLSTQTKMKIEMRRQMTERVFGEYGGLLDAMIDVAKGTFQEKKDVKGRTRIYTAAPSTDMLKHLNEQTIGKPKEVVSIDFGVDEDRDKYAA